MIAFDAIDHVEVAPAEDVQAKEDLARALAHLAIAERFVAARLKACSDAEDRLALALDETIARREDLLEAQDLVITCARVVAIRRGAR